MSKMGLVEKQCKRIDSEHAVIEMLTFYGRDI